MTPAAYLSKIAIEDAGRLTRGGTTLADDTITLSMPNLRVSASNTNYYLTLYQSTGATRTANSTVRWTRIG